MRKPTAPPGADSFGANRAGARSSDAEAPDDCASPKKDHGSREAAATVNDASRADEDPATPVSGTAETEPVHRPGDSLIWPPPEEELNGWEIIHLESTGRTLIEPGPRTADEAPAASRSGPQTPLPAPRLYSTIPTPPALPAQSPDRHDADGILPIESALPTTAAPPAAPVTTRPVHPSRLIDRDQDLPETQVIEPQLAKSLIELRSTSSPPATPPRPPAQPARPPQIIVQGGAPNGPPKVSPREQTEPRIVLATRPDPPRPAVTVPSAREEHVDPSAQTRIMPIPHGLARLRTPASMVETLPESESAVPNGAHADDAPTPIVVRPPAASASAPPPRARPEAKTDPWRTSSTQSPDTGSGAPWWTRDRLATPDPLQTNAWSTRPSSVPAEDEEDEDADRSALFGSHALLEPEETVDTEVPESDAPPDRRRFPLWRIALAVIALIAIAEVAYLLVRTLQPAAATALPATLVVESTPPGADVYIDGERRGRTPLRTELAAGGYELEVRAGTTSWIRTLTLEPGKLLTQEADLSVAAPAPPAPVTASLEIRSDPPGARVTIDGVDRGRTPVVVTGLAAGRRQVQLSGAVSATRRVTLVAGQQGVVEVTAPRAPDPPSPDQAAAASGTALRAPAVGRGWITVDSPIVLRIVRNGDFLGTSEDGRIPLPAGTHVIGLENESVNFREVRTVDVSPNRGLTVTVGLPQGTLNINALPWAEVTVDGQRIGETPVSQLALAIGPHEVLFRHPQYGERRVTVIVKVGSPGRTFVDFTK